MGWIHITVVQTDVSSSSLFNFLRQFLVMPLAIVAQLPVVCFLSSPKSRIAIDLISNRLIHIIETYKAGLIDVTA